MSKLLLLTILCGLLLIRCSPNNKDNLKVVLWKSKKIEIPANCLSSYVTQVFKGPLYYGYNYQTHAIDIFDLDKLKYTNSIMLAKEGPNAIIDVNGIAIVSDRLLFIINMKEIALINKLGEKQLRIGLSDLKKESGLTIALRSKNDLVFNDQKNVLVLPLRSENGFANNNFYNYPVLGLINLNDSTLQEYNFFYPKSYRKDFYGDFSYLNVSYSNNTLMLNFPISSNFYKMDFIKAVVKSYGEENVITSPISRNDFADVTKRVNYLYDQKFYSKIVMLATEQELYARILVYDNLDDRSLRRLQILNTRGVAQKEIEIPDNLAINFFTYDNKIYFNDVDKNESYLTFQYLEIQ